MFAKVLVANRGEIACRILRSLHALGVRSVAVYHHEDRLAPHVALADEAVELDGAVPTAAYLDAAQIITAARRTGAEALHPGYGFLSENADFAEAVQAAGLTFVGPDAVAMRLMGDKIRARRFASEQGVPVAPSAMSGGGLGAFADRAAAIGFPLLIKASAGGGGKGMRIVRKAADLETALRAATGEAQRYFGDGTVYAERLVERPRHIEVQVLGDGHGRVVHLGERDCSLQRRYQKIVEETPAPGLDEALRHEICAAAQRLAQAAKYRNAGTVEFILAPDGAFYFLEMNTRLQVEHPVTEMVLGIDLVAEQLRIAAGEPMTIGQETQRPAGHAIECRICAEEPEHDFRPATGRVGLLRLPQGPGIRCDFGIREGQAITPAFDPMLGKLIAHGASRQEAAGRLCKALQDLVLLGVPTNADYLARVMQNGEFLAGRVHTGFVTDHAAALAPQGDGVPREAVAAVAALGVDAFRRLAYDVPDLHAAIGHWRN